MEKAGKIEMGIGVVGKRERVREREWRDGMVTGDWERES
jgi:hypothetical protein